MLFRSIMIDCDVLQADGGTRTASITGSCVALALALGKLAKEHKITSGLVSTVWIDTVSAISVGIKDGQVLVDLDYNEDSSCEVDMNFVVTGNGNFVEVQGTAERQAFTKADLDRMTDGAVNACTEIRKIQIRALEAAGVKLG